MKILLLDDHLLFRSGLRFLLSTFADDVEFFEASNSREATEISQGTSVDLVLMDYHLPGVTGLDMLKQLRVLQPDAATVVLSGDETPSIIRSCIEEGAAGYIPKSSSQQVLIAALRLVFAGGIYLPRFSLDDIAAASAVPGTAADAGMVNQAVSSLSERQMEALRLAVRGLSNKRIAREMKLSEATVKAHLSAAFRAMGVHNRTEAVYQSARLGIK